VDKVKSEENVKTQELTSGGGLCWLPSGFIFGLLHFLMNGIGMQGNCDTVNRVTNLTWAIQEDMRAYVESWKAREAGNPEADIWDWRNIPQNNDNSFSALWANQHRNNLV
jgi:hypothetical protein